MQTHKHTNTHTPTHTHTHTHTLTPSPIPLPTKLTFLVKLTWRLQSGDFVGVCLLCMMMLKLLHDLCCLQTHAEPYATRRENVQLTHTLHSKQENTTFRFYRHLVHDTCSFKTQVASKEALAFCSLRMDAVGQTQSIISWLLL